MSLYYKFIGAPNLYHDYQPESPLSEINTILYCDYHTESPLSGINTILY